MVKRVCDVIYDNFSLLLRNRTAYTIIKCNSCRVEYINNQDLTSWEPGMSINVRGVQGVTYLEEGTQRLYLMQESLKWAMAPARQRKEGSMRKSFLVHSSLFPTVTVRTRHKHWPAHLIATEEQYLDSK